MYEYGGYGAGGGSSGYPGGYANGATARPHHTPGAYDAHAHSAPYGYAHDSPTGVGGYSAAAAGYSHTRPYAGAGDAYGVGSARAERGDGRERKERRRSPSKDRRGRRSRSRSRDPGSRGRDAKDGRKRSRRSKSRGPFSVVDAAMDEENAGARDTALMVPDKDAYIRLLLEVSSWSDAKKSNLLKNTYAMIQDKSSVALPKPARTRGDAAPRPPLKPPTGDDSKRCLLCACTVLQFFQTPIARVVDGVYIIASRAEWGFLALYRPRVAASVGSPVVVPSWEEVGNMQPDYVMLYLEISQLVEKSSTVLQLSCLRGEGSLKLQFPIDTCEQAFRAIKFGLVTSRPDSKLHFARTLCQAEFFVDGEEFFPKLGDAMLAAEREIFHAAWWMSPYIFLKRATGPGGAADVPDQNYRLDNLLQKKAMEGVRIYILLYQEVGQAISLTSAYTKSYLESLHSNIKVIRHRGSNLLFTHHQKFTVIDWTTLFIGGLDPCYGRFDTHDHPLFDEHSETFVGLDYRNPMLMADEEKSQKFAPFSNTLNRRKENRLPWHDIHIRLTGKAAYAAGLNFVQRWHHHPNKKSEYPMIVPDFRVLYSKEIQAVEAQPHVEAVLYRTMGEWSSSKAKDTGIHTAYLELIRDARKYIYIENQYFISSVFGLEVQNKVAQALCNRIIEAFTAKKTFRVLMLIQPHGEGDAVDDQHIRAILYYQNHTILRMNQLLLKTLGTHETVDKYLSIGYIQNYGFAPETGRAVFCPIYIHSKFMVVDDQRFIIGSANINDRSFNGDRDSELAAVVSPLSTSHAGCCEQVRALRMHLWREHFGLAEGQCADATSDATWQHLRNVMLSNSTIYESVFPAVPKNATTLLEEAQLQKSRPPIEERVDALRKIKGHAVRYPASWLSRAPLGQLARAAGTTLYV